MASQPPEFSVTVAASHAPAGDRTAVVVTGEVDLVNADEVGRVTREQLARGPVLLDLTAVPFMDSSGVRMLDALLRDCAREGWDLCLDARLQPGVAQVLRLTGMTGILPFAPATGEAGP